METFENGAKRSGAKLRYDLIPRSFIDGIAERSTMGSIKYGDENWRKGGDIFFRDAKNHLVNHVLAYLSGEAQDEASYIDHLKAAMWNAGILLEWETNMKGVDNSILDIHG